MGQPPPHAGERLGRRGRNLRNQPAETIGGRDRGGDIQAALVVLGHVVVAVDAEALD